jgi:tRNA pseudouridine55 synthase
MYSAVKVAGKRLYEMARAGEEVEREARQVTVYELLLRDFSATELKLSVRCSKGFFVRVLAADVGRALGCGAHLKALRRTAPFMLQQAIPMERLVELSKDPRTVAERLVSLSDALRDLPAVTVSEAEAARVAHGVPLEVRAPAGRVRVLGPNGRLLALAEVGVEGRLKYLRVLA